jgi:hypothetical protein
MLAMPLMVMLDVKVLVHVLLLLMLVDLAFLMLLLVLIVKIFLLFALLVLQIPMTLEVTRFCITPLACLILVRNFVAFSL